MKTKFLLIAILCFSINGYNQTWQWTHPEPNGSLTPNSEHDDAHDIEIDASGNAYVLGDFLGSLFLNNTFRATGSGSYLAKYDSTGAMLWYKLIIPSSSTGAIKATDLTITAQGVFVTGKYNPSNSGISNYDCNGGGTGNINSYSIADYNFNAGIYNEAGFFVTRLNSNGGVIWNQVIKGQVCFNNGYNASMSEISYNPLITGDKNNNIICEFLYTHNEPKRTSLSIGTGTIPLPLPIVNVNNLTCIVFKMNDAGALLWSNYAAEQEMSSALNDCNSIIADNNGNVFLYGNANDGCAFGSNIFHTTEYIKNGNRSWSTYLAKISESGAWQFVKELNHYSQNILASGGGNPDKLAVDNSDNIYAIAYAGGNGVYGIVTGDTVPINKTSAYLVKLDNNGNLIWHKGFGSNEATANSICFANNSFYISGRLRNFVYGGKLWYFSDLHVQPSSPDYGGTFECFISKASTDGNFQWATTFSGEPSASSFSDGNAVKAFNTNIYSAGYYRGNIKSLGNFNSNYTGDASTDNIFFGKLRDQSIRVDAVSAKQVMPGCSITIPFTSAGLTFSAKNKFTAELSNINWEFTNPTVIGSVKSTGTGSIKATIPSSLPVGTSGYKIRIRSSDTLPTGLNYFAYADTGYTLTIACPETAAGLSSTNITDSSATLKWSAVACAAGYKVQYRIKGTAVWTSQSVSSITTSLAISGLNAGTAYQWRIATKCNNNGVSSFSAYSSNQQFKTKASFTVSEANSRSNISVKTSFINLYPNPAKDNVTIQFNANKPGKYEIELTDISGKILQSKTTQTTAGENEITLDVSKYAKGMYLIKLTDNENGKSALKFSKE